MASMPVTGQDADLPLTPIWIPAHWCYRPIYWLRIRNQRQRSFMTGYRNRPPGSQEHKDIRGRMRAERRERMPGRGPDVASAAPITARDCLPPRRAPSSRERCRILAARPTVGSVRKRAQNAYPAWLGRCPTWVDVQPDGPKPDVSRQPWIPGDKDPFATGAIRSAAQAWPGKIQRTSRLRTDAVTGF
jgi:hypothetical protein